MTTLQIVLLAIAGACALVSIVFNVMFIIEISYTKKEKEEEEVQSVFTVNVITNANAEDEDVDAMLAKLDEETAFEEVEEEVEITEEAQEEVVETAETAEEDDILSAFIENDVVEEAETQEETQEVAEETVEEAQEEEQTEEVTEEIAEEVQEEVVEEEKPAETKEEAVEEAKEDDEEDDDEDTDATEDAEILEYTGLKEEPVDYSANGSIDYSARLEKIILTRDKIERDLAKVQKAILKYERTKRRKNRNQKMLDRRAGELTNLNLVMYSVTDIKNVDEDKKVKQEELTAHIAELKASIQDAEEYIESNKEKNDHNVKMAKFLAQEKTRYNEEIAELQALINSGDEDAK